MELQADVLKEAWAKHVDPLMPCILSLARCDRMQAGLHGVLPVHSGQFELLQQSALRWSNRLKQGVAVCNSLVAINKNTVVGADMERSMFKAVEARFLVSQMCQA